MKKLLAIAALFSLAACSKSDETKPTVTIQNPTNQQAFPAGTVVSISALIQDENEIHDVILKVINTATNVHVLHAHEHPDTKTFTLTKSFTVQAGTSYSIEVEATDHAENRGTAKVTVSAQ